MTISKLNHAVMNAQQDCFVISSDKGVKVFNTHPLVLLNSIDNELTGNARIAAILHRSNLICFVGSGKGTEYPANTALIYCDKKKKILIEYTVPGGPIRNVLMTTTRIVLLQERKVHIFSFPSKSKLIRAEDIRCNPYGLASISNDHLTSQLLAFPDYDEGKIRLMNLNNLSESTSLSPVVIKAHKSEIAQLALNNQGTLLATGSTTGTIVRIFQTRTQNLLMELRRGQVQANLHCISFSPCSSFLAASSDKGTIHIFAIRDDERSTSKSRVLRHVGITGAPDIASTNIESRVLAIGFGGANSSSLNSFSAICSDGTYHRYHFNVDGYIQREGFDVLLSLANEQEFWHTGV